MASYIKRGNKTRVQVLVEGKRESATFDSKAEATAWAKAKESGRLPSNRAAMPLKSVLMRYAEEVSPTKKGGHWEIMRLRAWMREDWTLTPLRLVTPQFIAQHRDVRLASVSAGTVLRELALLSSVLTHAQLDWGLLDANPVKPVRKPKAPPDRRRRITSDEIERLLQALDYAPGEKPTQRRHVVAMMFQLGIETAMRSGEMCDLTWRHVHDDYLHLPRTKNGKPRDVALTPDAQAIIKLMPKGKPDDLVFGMTASQRDALFRKARDVAEVTDLHFHDSRAEGIYRLSKKLDVLELARQVGHGNLSSLLIYYQATGSEMASKLK